MTKGKIKNIMTLNVKNKVSINKNSSKPNLKKISAKTKGWSSSNPGVYSANLKSDTIKNWSDIYKERNLKKFSPNDEKAAQQAFVRDGYVIYENAYPKKLIDKTRELFFRWYNQLNQAHKDGKIDKDIHGWGNSILDKYERSQLYKDLINNPNIIKIMKGYLGPDVCHLNNDAFLLNVPDNKDPVMIQGQHVDAWVGTSVHTIYAQTYYTNVDKYNGICVSPGSHTLGLIPVRNRKIDPAYNLEFENINLDCLSAGDFVLWHSLLVHATTGQSDKNIRVAMTSRFTSTETPFTSQERALGYRTISVGPMNQIMRLVGTDLLQPFRTHGGFVGVDRRLSALYGHSDYQKDVNYEDFLD